MRWGLALLTALALLIATTRSRAGECRVKTPEEHLQRASVAFVGRALGGTTQGNVRETRFRLGERFKGAEGTDTVLVAVANAKGLPEFTEGADYLVFARSTPGAELAVEECSGTTQVSLPAAFENEHPDTKAAYLRDAEATLQRLRAARAMPRAAATDSVRAGTLPCDPNTQCTAASNDAAPRAESSVHFGGLHLLGGVGAGTSGSSALRASLEAGAGLTFAPRAQSTRDGWSAHPTQGLVAGLAWSQGLERLRGEAYADVGWGTTASYGGLLVVGGPAVRVLREQNLGLSARGCGWVMALELCVRGTGALVGHTDASAMLLFGLGVQ